MSLLGSAWEANGDPDAKPDNWPSFYPITRNDIEADFAEGEDKVGPSLLQKPT